MSGYPSIAVVGGGPAGLSLSKLLKEHGFQTVTVFEAADRVGGKSYSIRRGGAIHDMGTCYTTLSYFTVHRWMREHRVSLRALGKQVMDGSPFMKFLREGEGGSILREGPRFIQEWGKTTRAFAAGGDAPEIRAEMAAPITDWLDAKGLKRMRRFMLRAFTSIGYGALEDISTIQALRWATPRLLVTGLLAQLKMPLPGWQGFWERLADGLDVRLVEPVKGIERDDAGVAVTTPSGEHRFDQLVVAVPIDDLPGVMTLTEDERFIADSVRWNTYVTTLCRVGGWFQDWSVEAYSAPLVPDAKAGALLSARRALGPGVRSTDLYVAGQYGHTLKTDARGFYDGALGPEGLARELRSEIEARGGRFGGVLCQKAWKYFPRYQPEAVREGLIPKLSAVQGRRRTWFTGATFSFETVGNISEFNVELAQQMARALKPAKTGGAASAAGG
jgi:hypothetical protein